MNERPEVSKEELRAVIAEVWDRIVGAGPTGDDMAIDWLTAAIWARLTR